MSAVFLSASVPVPGRGDYFKTADPYLIQKAVRELVIFLNGRHQLVWGGHPAITPMVLAICEDLGIDYAQAVVLYQSRYFEGNYPEENQPFDNVVYVEAVPGDKEQSLLALRQAMLSREDLAAAVFIGGMEGVEEECRMFQEYHPGKVVLPVGATGGAAGELAGRFQMGEVDLFSTNFSALYGARLLGEAVE